MITMNLIVYFQSCLLIIISLCQMIHSQQHQAQLWQKQNLNKIHKYLTERQQELVRQNPGSLWAVARAIKIAIKECQYQMRNELWDCPTYGFSVRPADTFGMLMSRNFKETSFVQSLLSAAIAHSVSRACTESIITTCSRKQLPHGNGFGEDIEFGRQFSRDFLDNSRSDGPKFDYVNSNNQNNNNNNNIIIGHDKQLSSNAIMGASNGNNIDYKKGYWKERRFRQILNEHNDEVGRLVVLNNMRRECKCHGISGACSMKTCWNRLPEFKQVAEKLHEKLYRAKLVAMSDFNYFDKTRHKSATLTTFKKSNKKRSSSPHLLSGLGRSPQPAQPASPAVGAAVHAATPSPSGTSISDGGRLPAHQEANANTHMANINMNSISNDNAVDGDIGGVDTGVDISDSGGIDKQSAREFVSQNSVQYSPILTPQLRQQQQQQQQQALGNSTLARRRPIARSIDPADQGAPDKSYLVYAENSLNYCLPIERYNVKGTKGRACSERRTDANSCETLCCGRGYKTEIREEKYTCECKFQYCCILKCNTCTRRKVIHKCL